MKTTLCDGSVVEWEPEYLDDECDECGHVTLMIDWPVPSFHGHTVRRENSYFCERCGEEFVGLAKATAIVAEKMIPHIVEQVNKTNAFYARMKGRRG